MRNNLGSKKIVVVILENIKGKLTTMDAQQGVTWAFQEGCSNH